MGVDLPGELRGEYQNLRSFLRTWIGEIGEEHPDPHITIYYLGIVTQSTYSLANRIIEDHIKEVSGFDVEIGGYKFFDNLFPALCLEVNVPAAMLGLRYALEDRLGQNIKDKNLPYDPHLSIAELKMLSSLRTCRNPPEEMLDFINSVKWSFSITEIKIAGKIGE